jgi:REP element-mobilizing transposase RayT
MILAAHLIFSAYGFWLSNDPRGSWSDFIRQWELLRYGPATKTDERRSLAARPHNSALRAAAKRELMYEPVIFSGAQALAIANGLGDVIRRTGCVVHACAIMPDHVHLVVARHHYEIQKLANLLKGGATTRLRKSGLDPFSGCPQDRVAPSPWAHKYWKVWLDSAEDVLRAIDYVDNNPIREGLKPQIWKFVKPYSA